MFNWVFTAFSQCVCVITFKCLVLLLPVYGSVNTKLSSDYKYTCILCVNRPFMNIVPYAALVQHVEVHFLQTLAQIDDLFYWFYSLFYITFFSLISYRCCNMFSALLFKRRGGEIPVHPSAWPGIVNWHLNTWELPLQVTAISGA